MQAERGGDGTGAPYRGDPAEPRSALTVTDFTPARSTDPGVSSVSSPVKQTSHRPREAGSSRTGIVLIVAAGVAIALTTAFTLRSRDAPLATSADTAPTPTVAAGDRSATDITVATTTAPASTTTAPPTTVAPTTSTTTMVPAEPDPPADPPTYRSGDSGPEVAAIQARLLELGFWLPAPDGHYGSLTSQAVMAFQKSAGIGRDGIAGPATLAALDTATAVVPRDGSDHIEIDLQRQLMIIVHSGQTTVLNTSTGRPGWRTPPGNFTIRREIDGIRHADLGDMYRPKYFNGGIALHGSSSIPGYAASHGCTRLSNGAVDMIWADGLAPIGTPVWVY